MRFFYFMNGDGIGSLKIDILFDNGERETIWKLSSHRGVEWFEGQVGFTSKDMTYK